MTNNRVPDLATERMRAAIRKVIEDNETSLREWCMSAGISEGTPRSFLKGRTKAIQSSNLIKMSDALNYPVAALYGEPPKQMRVTGWVREGGRIEVAGKDAEMPTVDMPTGWDPLTIAFRVAGTGNLPELGDGDTVFVKDEFMTPDSLFGLRCIIRSAGGQLFVGRMQSGSAPGLVTLSPINAAPQLDLSSVRAMHIFAIKPAAPRG